MTRSQRKNRNTPPGLRFRRRVFAGRRGYLVEDRRTGDRLRFVSPCAVEDPADGVRRTRWDVFDLGWERPFTDAANRADAALLLLPSS